MTELKERENKLYQAIVDFINQNNYPPTVRELCCITNVKSTNTVHRDIKALKEKGYITYEARTMRTIRVLSQIE